MDSTAGDRDVDRNLPKADGGKASVAAMAAPYAHEFKVPMTAKTKAQGLGEHYQVDAAATQYSMLHQTAEVAHSRVWQRLIDESLATSPDDE